MTDDRAVPSTIRTVIPRIETSIVEITIHPKPVRAIDAPARRRVRPMRERTHHFEPASGAPRDVAHFERNLREILVLTEHDRHVEPPVARHAYDVEPEPQVDALLACDGKLVDGPVGEPNPLDPIA